MNQELNISLVPMGIIHSPYHDKASTPKNGRLRPEIISEIEIFPEYLDCISNIDHFQYIHIIFWADKSKRTVLKCHPHGNYSKEEVGVFGTRSPERPNPILTSLVELIEIKDNIIKVKMLDAMDGSILIDIKPYLKNCDDPSFDI